MRDLFKLGLKLFAIAAVAGLALGFTNMVTSGPIAEQQMAEANAARIKVLPAAASFNAKEDPGALDEIYEGLDAAGTPVGYTGMITVTGFGGPIEVTVGVDRQGVITGVNVGGTDFSETAGLGARTKEDWFGEQFIGMSGHVALKKNGGEVDAVTSATISSNAVTNGVETALTELTPLAKGGN